LVGKINGKWSSLNFSPISYLYTELSLEEQAALYAAADMALLTPLREGMNLVYNAQPPRPTRPPIASHTNTTALSLSPLQFARVRAVPAGHVGAARGERVRWSCAEVPITIVTVLLHWLDQGSVLIRARVFFCGSLVGAILVNPWNTRALTEAIITALTMDDEEKKARYGTRGVALVGDTASCLLSDRVSCARQPAGTSSTAST
jgi:hypothetical protein